MTLSPVQKLYVSTACFLAMIVLAVWCVCTGSLSPYALLLLLPGTYLLGKTHFNVFFDKMFNPVHVLSRALPKCGFAIDSVEWNDDNTVARFYGKFKDDKFIIDASPVRPYVDIIDLPWSQISTNDAIAPRLIESVNAINGQRIGPRVILMAPDESGIRHLMTVYTTILPIYKVHQFIEATLIEMLNRKPALYENFQTEKPWLEKVRGPIGFAAPQPAAAASLPDPA